jgi:hypothetical protein
MSVPELGTASWAGSGTLQKPVIEIASTDMNSRFVVLIDSSPGDALCCMDRGSVVDCQPSAAHWPLTLKTSLRLKEALPETLSIQTGRGPVSNAQVKEKQL